MKNELLKPGNVDEPSRGYGLLVLPIGCKQARGSGLTHREQVAAVAQCLVPSSRAWKRHPVVLRPLMF